MLFLLRDTAMSGIMAVYWWGNKSLNESGQALLRPILLH